MKKHMWGCLVLIMLAACGDSNTENKEKEGVETILPQQVNEVTVMKLVKGDFNHELVPLRLKNGIFTSSYLLSFLLPVYSLLSLFTLLYASSKELFISVL